MDSWYYKLSGDEYGPVSLEELVGLAKNRALSSDDEVRFGEKGPWRRAGSMGQLMAHMASGSHLPSNAASSTVAATSKPTAATSSRSAEPTGWYYQSFGAEFGPLTLDELIELAKSHSLSVDDEVRFGESGPWRRAGSIGQLMSHLPFQAGKKAFTVEVEKSASGKRGSDAQIEVSDELDSFFNSQPVMPVAKSVSQPPKPRRSAPVPVPVAAPEPEPEPEPESEPEPAADVWWCIIQGKEYGPVELAKLISWAANGRLLRKDYVRHGMEAYIVAGELPGLFPELPSEVAAAETKADLQTKSPTRIMPRVETPVAAQSEVSRSEPVSAPADAPRPVTNWQANSAGAGGGAAMSRPAAPVRRPSSKGGSGGLDKLMMPALGVVGVGLLGALIYFVLPLVMGGGDLKRFVALRSAYNQIKFTRNGENVKKEDFKKVTAKLVEVAKPIEAELKGKAGAPTVKLRTLAKKLQEISKEDLTKPVEAEKSIDKLIVELKKLLKAGD